MSTLKVDLRVGEAIRISGSGSATIILEAKSGQRGSLVIKADPTMRISPPKPSEHIPIVSRGLDGPRGT